MNVQMTSPKTQISKLGKGKVVMSWRKQEDEFTGFLANPQALRRGGPAVQAARRLQRRRGLLERLAQAEIQRFWQAEIAAKSSSL